MFSKLKAKKYKNEKWRKYKTIFFREATGIAVKNSFIKITEFSKYSNSLLERLDLQNFFKIHFNER